jgi:hypothetical protein
VEQDGTASRKHRRPAGHRNGCLSNCDRPTSVSPSPFCLSPQIEAVQVGQAVAIKLDAFPAETIPGHGRRNQSAGCFSRWRRQLTNLHGSELPTISSGPKARPTGGSALPSPDRTDQPSREVNSANGRPI